ncbi:hypothetical protein DFH29DRAFT_883506 [Suillus ampliporus]|nr:hypothetical protein DFH29DRAFT_883506 [Suillus ampliporus]
MASPLHITCPRTVTEPTTESNGLMTSTSTSLTVLRKDEIHGIRRSNRSEHCEWGESLIQRQECVAEPLIASVSNEKNYIHDDGLQMRGNHRSVVYDVGGSEIEVEMTHVSVVWDVVDDEQEYLLQKFRWQPKDGRFWIVQVDGPGRENGISETIVSFIRQSFPAVRNLRYNQVGTFGHYSSIATILPGAGWYKKYKAEAYPSSSPFRAPVQNVLQSRPSGGGRR